MMLAFIKRSWLTHRGEKNKLLYIFYKNNVLHMRHCHIEIILIPDELCIKKFIPSIRNTSKAPMAAVHAILGTIAIHRWVCICSLLWQFCNVEQVDWLWHTLQHFLYYHFCRMWKSWWRRKWSHLSAAVLSLMEPPKASTNLTTIKLFIIINKHTTISYIQKCKKHSYPYMQQFDMSCFQKNYLNY